MHVHNIRDNIFLLKRATDKLTETINEGCGILGCRPKKREKNIVRGGLKGADSQKKVIH